MGLILMKQIKSNAIYVLLLNIISIIGILIIVYGKFQLGIMPVIVPLAIATIIICKIIKMT